MYALSATKLYIEGKSDYSMKSTLRGRDFFETEYCSLVELDYSAPGIGGTVGHDANFGQKLISLKTCNFDLILLSTRFLVQNHKNYVCSYLQKKLQAFNFGHFCNFLAPVYMAFKRHKI